MRAITRSVLRLSVLIGLLLALVTLSGGRLHADAGDEEGASTQVASSIEAQVESDPLALAWQDLSPGYYAATNLPLSGKGMYYNPGVMERVLAFRLESRHVSSCLGCIGYAAMLRRGDLDRTVWLRRQGKPAEGPFWVIDVADRRHVGMLRQRDWVVDIDYETAMRWRMNRPIPLTVVEEPTVAELWSSHSLPLNWDAAPVPAENFHWPEASAVYHGEALLEP